MAFVLVDLDGERADLFDDLLRLAGDQPLALAGGPQDVGEFQLPQCGNDGAIRLQQPADGLGVGVAWSSRNQPATTELSSTKGISPGLPGSPPGDPFPGRRPCEAPAAWRRRRPPGPAGPGPARLLP